jgi:small multidrug resistance pump
MFTILMSICWLFIAVTMEVIGTLLLPKTKNFKVKSLTVLCLTSYVISFYALSMLMEGVPPVVAYSVWSGMGIVMITLLSSLLYQLQSSPMEKVGIGCIVAGLIVIAF